MSGLRILCRKAALVRGWSAAGVSIQPSRISTRSTVPESGLRYLSWHAVAAFHTDRTIVKVVSVDFRFVVPLLVPCRETSLLGDACTLLFNLGQPSGDRLAA